MQKKRSKNLLVAKEMPPLYHKLPGEDFNFKKSEVLKWISERPSLLLYVFNHLEHAEIEYNPNTGKWQGVNYEEDVDYEEK